ncbi:brain-specific angiogenesis inhibitor 1-associated protein 2-like protein 2 [Dermochelys coriacea]|uniref:brain-specific angiogenesis inhibitor 1-associated protein 2-like protein 2 n=1 Tax=Dermochelys coriacea TaxID=27794 RepID=UPI0018E7505E|nr:brain-specific angiogenesis inhibitor 1-associated protein 2-like protein 2 [Dermochelys coriacea]
MEQSYRSTISIYKNILEQFNPALENLVYLGNNYLRTFHALSEAADVYFKAIQKIGEQALQSSTSQMLGQILIQMSDTHRHMNSDLEVVTQTFHRDLLQHIEKNTKLDMQFINDSHRQYELEYRHRAANLEKCMSELWRMERTQDKNIWEMKENVRRLHSEMQAFVSESQRAAALEEKRRYRFLAEKHQLLSSTFLQVYSRAWGIIQSKVPKWKEQLEASRNPSSRHSPSLLSASHGQGYPSGRLTPSHLNMPQRPLGDFGSAMTGRSSSPFPQEPAELLRPSPQPEPTRRGLQKTSSAGSLSAGQRSRSSSFGEQARGGSNVLRVQTIVPHSTGTNRTLLGFNPGDIITVLIPKAQNGWLYGKLEGSSTSGWFPEAFVKPLEGVRDPEEPPTRSFPLRSSHSVDGLDCPSVPSAGIYRHNAAPPQSPSPSPASRDPGSRQSSFVSAAAPSDSKKSAVQEQPPELFPRGTNPFATVKLRPTVTNDRSAPIIQ